LEKAKSALLNSKKTISNSFSGEFISVDLRTAADNLSEIIGIVTSEDILNNIFQKFCIGK
jgi:tRNA modification GTPase